MPRALPRQRPEISIRLKEPQSTFATGDLIYGSVIVNEKLAKEPRGLQLRFSARTKTKLRRRRGNNNSSTYRGSTSFFDVRITLEEEDVGHGDRGGSRSWAFSALIPISPSGTMKPTSGDKWHPTPGFLATPEPTATEVDTGTDDHRLPGTYYFEGSSLWGGDTVEAFVEYVLTASLMGQEPATLPLTVRSTSTHNPITDYEVRQQHRTLEIKDKMLLPIHANSPMTFKEHVTGVFKPSSKPKYHFQIQLKVPSIIQVKHYDSFPFVVKLIPNISTSSTSIWNGRDFSTLPQVRLVSFKLSIKSSTRVRCPRMMWGNEVESSQESSSSICDPARPIKAPYGDFRVPYDDTSKSVETLGAEDPGGHSVLHPMDGVEDAFGTIDLGRILDLRIPRYGVYPTFKTYNIALSHRLKWEIALECVGDREQIIGSSICTILGPSESQVKGEMTQWTDE